MLPYVHELRSAKGARGYLVGLLLPPASAKRTVGADGVMHEEGGDRAPVSCTVEFAGLPHTACYLQRSGKRLTAQDKVVLTAGQGELLSLLPYVVTGVSVDVKAEDRDLVVRWAIKREGVAGDFLPHVVRIEVADAAGVLDPDLARNATSRCRRHRHDASSTVRKRGETAMGGDGTRRADRYAGSRQGNLRTFRRSRRKLSVFPDFHRFLANDLSTNGRTGDGERTVRWRQSPRAGRRPTEACPIEIVTSPATIHNNPVGRRKVMSQDAVSRQLKNIFTWLLVLGLTRCAAGQGFGWRGDGSGRFTARAPHPRSGTAMMGPESAGQPQSARGRRRR